VCTLINFEKFISRQGQTLSVHHRCHRSGDSAPYVQDNPTYSCCKSLFTPRRVILLKYLNKDSRLSALSKIKYFGPRLHAYSQKVRFKAFATGHYSKDGQPVLGPMVFSVFRHKRPDRKDRGPLRSLIMAQQKNISRHPIIVERRNTAHSNRLIETSRMVTKSPFYDHWKARYSTKRQQFGIYNLRYCATHRIVEYLVI
jgi:hypothetical protein